MDLLITGGVVAACGVLLMVISEYALRFWLRNHARNWAFFPHSRLEMTIMPEICRYLTDRTVTYEVNEEGERAGPVPRGKKLYRVLVVGGSAAECRLLNREHSWAGVLERELNRPESLRALGAEVVHVGQMAMSQVDSRTLLRVLENTLRFYKKLDLIIVMNGASDPLRWLEEGAPSGGVPDVADMGMFMASYPEKEYGWRNPALVRYFLKRIRVRFQVERFQNVGRTIRDEGIARNAVKEFVKLDSDPAAMLDLYESTLRKVLRLAWGKTTRLMVVRQPWLDCYSFSPEDEKELWCGRVGHPKSAGPAKFLSHSDLMHYLRLMDERAVRASAAERVECLSVMEALPHRLGIFYDHFHFTKEGCEIVGRTVAAAVLAPGEAAK